MSTRQEQEAFAGHVWKYFEIHAGQRLTVFNFFSAFSGLIAAAIGAVGQASSDYAVVGIVLGAMLTIISFIFWKLDQRAAFLVKHAEEALKVLEGDTQTSFSLFAKEPVKHLEAQEAGNWITRPWTFGESFRCLFGLMAASGVAAAVFFTFRLLHNA